MPKRILFLLGAGASKEAGYPLTDEITERIFSGDYISCHNNYFFYSPDQINIHPKVALVRNILSLVRSSWLDNYEEAYTSIQKIRHEVSSIASSPFKSDIEQYQRHLRDIIARHIDPFFEKLEPFNVLGLAMDFIQDVFDDMLWLRRREARLDSPYLDLYLRLLEKVDGLDLFTLNQDTLLEDYFKLKSENNLYTDGFIEGDCDIAHWDSNLFFDNKYQVRLFKVHGSINWYWVNRPVSATPVTINIGGIEAHSSTRRQLFLVKSQRRLADSDYELRDSTGNLFETEEGRPWILIGTESKLYRYQCFPFLILLAHFAEHLEKYDRIVVIGYSFGDRAINGILLDWYEKDISARKIYLINKNGGFSWRGPYPTPEIIVSESDGIENASVEEIIDFVDP